MQFAIKKLSKVFTKKTGIECELVISSSGKLTAQIKEGAPFSIFVAANMKYPEAVYKSGLAAKPPKVYAHGKLVLWSALKEVKPSLELLTKEYINHIAVANPKTAPYGQAAIEVLQHFGLYEQVEKKLVYGESIAQTNQFITSKSAEIGFTAMAVVLSPEMEGVGKWVELDADDFEPIEQGVVIIRQEEEVLEKAIQFYEFLFSKEAKSILRNYGYFVGEQ